MDLPVKMLSITDDMPDSNIVEECTVKTAKPAHPMDNTFGCFPLLDIISRPGKRKAEKEYPMSIMRAAPPLS